jgi:opacity protein-like surface antigen
MKKTLVTLAAVCALVAPAAFAGTTNSSTKDFYVRLDAGSTFKNRLSNSLGDTPLSHTMKTKKSTGVFAAGAGMYFPLNLRADITYNQYLTMKRTVTMQGIVSGDYNYRLTSRNVMLTGYYDIPTAIGITPYGQNKLKPTSYAATGLTTVQGFITGKTMSGIVYTVGLGASYAFTDNVAVDVSYRYADLGKAKSGTRNIDAAGSFYYSLEKGRLSTQSVLAGFRFSF